MDMVRIRAAVSAHGLVKGQKVTVAETPVIAGGIGKVFELLERFPAEPAVAVAELACTEPECILYEGHDNVDPDVHTDIHGEHWTTGEREQVNTEAVSDPPEASPPAVEDLELPDPASTDDGETPATEYQPPGKKPRG